MVRRSSNKARTCTDKRRRGNVYPTMDEARAAAEAQTERIRQKRPNETIIAYDCPYCDDYHTGHTPFFRRLNRANYGPQ